MTFDTYSGSTPAPAGVPLPPAVEAHQGACTSCRRDGLTIQPDGGLAMHYTAPGVGLACFNTTAKAQP